MSEGRRTRRWHECLAVIKVPPSRPAPEMQKLFDAGKNAHARLEALLGNIRAENARTFTDPTLPFDIIYHADLWDQANRIVYDIKPAVWLANNMGYCLAQLSGYAHFLDAKAMGFVQYARHDGEIEGPWVTFVPLELRRPWDPELRSIAVASDQLLGESET